MKKFLLFLMVVLVYIVHQDNWNWKSADLIFGFLPVGMAYHAGYSVLAAIMMAILVSRVAGVPSGKNRAARPIRA